MELVQVKSSRELKQFFEITNSIYNEKYPNYVAPLRLQMKMLIGDLKKAEQKHLYMVKKGNEYVARCGFKVHNHNGHDTLHFGFFECKEGHQDAAQALINKGHSLFPHLTLRGPFHFRMEDPYIGILVEGFEQEPYFLMSYNPPYYSEYLERCGMVKTMDLFTYELTTHRPVDPLIKENAKTARDNGYKIRFIDKKKLKDEARTIAKIFNDALSDNWGFEEFIESQVNEMVLMFKFFLDLRVVAIVHKDGKDIGCLIMIPNFNPMIKPSNGKFSPSLIWRYFNRYKFTNGHLRGYALGVLKEHHGQGIGSLLVDEMYKIGAEIGYNNAEISWVLANNGPMNELSKAMNGKQSKVYRIFDKTPVELTQ
jgi:GNAT superfamily N-acetyltransferase